MTLPAKQVSNAEYDQAVRRIARDAYARNPARIPAAHVVPEIEAFCAGSDVCSIAMWHDVNHAYAAIGGAPHAAGTTAGATAGKTALLLVASASVAGVVWLSRAWGRGRLDRYLPAPIHQGR